LTWLIAIEYFIAKISMIAWRKKGFPAGIEVFKNHKWREQEGPYL
jgi:hypothetical protein